MLFRKFRYGIQTLREVTLDAVPPVHSPLTRTSAFRESMRAVQDLALSFDSWYNIDVWIDETSATPDSPCCHIPHIFTEFIGEWIGQNQAVLKRLSLAFDNYVGYYPRLDLRDLQYPRLRVLELSCVTLSHRLHVSWIVAHQATLTTLYLCDCPILVKAETNQVLDAEDLPVLGKLASEPVTFAPANLFWWSMLDTFRMQLTALRDFKVEFTCMDPGVQGVVSGMWSCRYKAYKFGEIATTGTSRWVGEDLFDADVAAYVRLKGKIGQIRQVQQDLEDLVRLKGDPGYVGL